MSAALPTGPKLARFLRASFINQGRNRMPKVIAIDSNKPRRILVIVQSHNGEQILIWTQYDEEGEILHRLIPGSIHLTGKTKQQDRLDILESFRNGKIQILISKPRLLGTGLNLQFL